MPTTYEVKRQESVLSIAKRHGFAWETIWNHAENHELHALPGRKPHVLLEGDRVHVPDRERKWVSKPVDARHEFRIPSDPVVFRMQLKRFGEPRPNVEYALEVGNKRFRGTTNGEGELEHSVPADASGGRLVLPATNETYPVVINRLDPIETTTGVQQRLKNLGYGPITINGELDERTRDAVTRYQNTKGLEPTGEPDDATRSALEGDHP